MTHSISVKGVRLRSIKNPMRNNFFYKIATCTLPFENVTLGSFSNIRYLVFYSVKYLYVKHTELEMAGLRIVRWVWEKFSKL